MKTTDENNAMNQQHEPQAQNAGNDVCRAKVIVGFPEETGNRLMVRNDCTFGLMKRIGSEVCVYLDHEEVLSVMYKEDYDPQSTFSAYKARAKEYALSVFAAMRARSGNDLSQEAPPRSETRYAIKINSSDNPIAGFTMSPEKDDIELRIEQLECCISELKKSTPTKDEVLALDEMKETILDLAARLSCASRSKEHFQRP